MLNVKLCSQEAYLEPSWTYTMELFFTSVETYFKNVLNSIELPLGSILYTAHPLAKKLTTLKSSGEVIHYFKYYGQNIFSRIMSLCLIPKVEIIMKLSHEIIKLKHEIILCQKEKRSKTFQVKAIRKDVRKTIVPSFMFFFLICPSLSSFL